jgi:hypothetical protein
VSLNCGAEDFLYRLSDFDLRDEDGVTRLKRRGLEIMALVYLEQEL